MRFWKKSKEPIPRGGLQQRLLHGASREDLLREAMADVMKGGGANRFGVWLEPVAEDKKGEGVLRGTVWDNEIAATPPEWQWLAPETVLPSVRLLCGTATEMDLTRDESQPIVGPLTGLSRVVWTPVLHAGKLRGVLLAGAHGTRTKLPRERLLDVSAELSIALEFEAERETSNERHADNALCERILAGLQTQIPPERLLKEIVESCLVRSARPNNPGAAFSAVVKARRGSGAAERQRIALEFSCAAGKAEGNWLAVHKTVKTLVRRALESGRTLGTEVRHLSEEEFLRVVVVPLCVRGKKENILLAAFRPVQASLASRERLELRGYLAASVLSAMEEREPKASGEEHRKTQAVPATPVDEPASAEEKHAVQAKLFQTERLAALGQMASGVAHELSNPLTSILGYAQRFLLRNDAKGNCEEIRKILGEAERAGAILRQILLAARENTPERRLFSLNQIVQRTIDLQRFSLAAERIRVEVSLDMTLPNVLGDAGQLQQVLINLVGNARHAIESQGHGGTIRVRTCRTQDERVRLEVRDSGPGIPEGIMARIFDPFFTTKPPGVGTGLGLSIVLSLVREHGGQVIVSSPRGSGAIFVVELPTAEPQETTEGIVQRGAALQPSLRIESGNSVKARKASETQRVLVVEDEPTVAQLISDVLRDAGFEIEVILDGREVLERAFRAPFDLIICDMKMPNLDGQTLYQTLSAREKGAPKSFLFVTGDVLGVKTNEFLAKHHLPYVAKPFRVEELLEKVHHLLEPAGNGSSPHVTALRKNSATTG